MMFEQPACYFVATGHAEGYSQLNAFDQALLSAGVGDTNLVRVTSILPPRCERVDPLPLPYGALVPVAYAGMTSSLPGELVSAAVGIALPSNPDLPGLIMEYHGAVSLEEARHQARLMAVSGMQYREREISDVLVAGVSHEVLQNGAAWAGVILWI